MTRRHLTASGRFEVVRRDGVLVPVHIPTGLSLGGFSHIAVRTFKAALEGLEHAEGNVGPCDWRLIDGVDSEADWPGERRKALMRLRDAMQRAFPNGAWG